MWMLVMPEPMLPAVHIPHLIEHLLEVVARRQLERWEVHIGHEFLR